MISRIRTVTPKLFTHKCLFTCCDRERRFRWQARRLMLSTLPYDEVDFAGVLNILWSEGYIQKYTYQGEYYGCIPSRERHPYMNNDKTKRERSSSKGPSFISVQPLNKNLCQNNPLAIESVFHDACVMREARVNDASRACTNVKEGHRSFAGTRPCAKRECIQQVFEYWKKLMGDLNTKRDPKRKALIGKALDWGYEAEALCIAMRDCSMTAHNQGYNDRGQRYDGLHVIFEIAIKSLQPWATQKVQEGNVNAR